MNRFLKIILLFLFSSNSFSQKKILTYADVIELAKTQSPSAVQAKSKFKNSYWEYRIYKSEKLPTLSFNGTLPSASRSIARVTTLSGDVFVERKYTSWQGGMSLSQNIPFTGGNLSVNSSLEQLQFFGPSGYTTFLANPISIGVVQPLFQFNN